MTTANYAPSALQKASPSIPRILTLNGDQIVSMMIEHHLGVKSSMFDAQKLDIDPDYFTAFELMRNLLVSHVEEDAQNYVLNGVSETQSIDLKPEEDLISVNALGYALRVDPVRVRRWVESETLKPDAAQFSGGRTNYYFRRDSIETIRKQLGIGNMPLQATSGSRNSSTSRRAGTYQGRISQ